MPLWLSELLADPGLGAHVVAGTAGVDRRGPIRWAHISELPDPTPWLEGGELLLTTGLGVRDRPDLQRRFVSGVAECGVVALGFSMGVSMDHLPRAMVEECERRQLPLFTMPYEIPFIAVSRLVAHHAFEQHYATLRRAMDLHRQVLTAVTADTGIVGVLGTVARAMPAAALAAFDFAGTELGRVDASHVAEDLDARRIWNALPGHRSHTRFALDGREVQVAPVVLNEQLEAVVVAISHDQLVEHEQLLFEQGIAGVSLELARRRSVRDAHRTRVDELVEDVVAGHVAGGELARRLARIGLPDGSPYHVLALQISDRVPPETVCTVVEDALSSCGPVMVGNGSEGILAIVIDGAEPARRVVDALRRRGWRGYRLGRSRLKHDPDALRAAVREARAALRLSGDGPVLDVGDLGLDGLLAGMRDDLGTAEYVTHVLGPVIAHDERESSHLVATLRAYLAHGCRPGPAAQSLSIHRHTLTYRLERVHELTGRNPRSGEHLVEFGLALQLLEREIR